MPALPDLMVVMGHVSAPFGVRGWIRVSAYTEAPDGLLDYPVWWLRKNGEWRECAVAGAEMHSKGLVAKLAGCDDREAAAALQGSEIGVPRDQLPDAQEDEYYWSDLVGLTVVNLEGVELGQVERLLETGANDVLVVKGVREHLIPFVGAFIREVDLAGKVLRVDWGADY